MGMDGRWAIDIVPTGLSVNVPFIYGPAFSNSCSLISNWACT